MVENLFTTNFKCTNVGNKITFTLNLNSLTLVKTKQHYYGY
jgi:hypothetical protein